MRVDRGGAKFQVFWVRIPSETLVKLRYRRSLCFELRPGRDRSEVPERPTVAHVALRRFTTGRRCRPMFRRNTASHQQKRQECDKMMFHRQTIICFPISTPPICRRSRSGSAGTTTSSPGWGATVMGSGRESARLAAVRTVAQHPE